MTIEKEKNLKWRVMCEFYVKLKEIYNWNVNLYVTEIKY